MPTNKELEKRVIALEEALKGAVEKPRTLEAISKKDDENFDLPIEEGTEAPKPDKSRKAIIEERLGGESDMIPPKYRELTDKYLNQEFGIHLKAEHDRPMHTFTILVPAEYSPLSEEDLKFDGADIRPKVVNNSDIANEVEEWCKLVRKNFDDETRLRIDKDRKSLVEPQ